MEIEQNYLNFAICREMLVPWYYGDLDYSRVTGYPEVWLQLAFIKAMHEVTSIFVSQVNSLTLRTDIHRPPRIFALLAFI